MLKHRSSLSIRRCVFVAFAVAVLIAGGQIISQRAAAFGAQSQAGAQAQNGERLDEVVLTVRADGFAPREVRRPTGRFLLYVDDRSESEDLTFLLKRANGEVLRRIEIQRGTIDWRESIELAEGVYALTEADHPNWSCRIVVH